MPAEEAKVYVVLESSKGVREQEREEPKAGEEKSAKDHEREGPEFREIRSARGRDRGPKAETKSEDQERGPRA